MKKESKIILFIILGIILLSVIIVGIYLASGTLNKIIISDSKYGTPTYNCDYSKNLCTFEVNYLRKGTFMENDVKIAFQPKDGDSVFHVITSKENCDKIGGEWFSEYVSESDTTTQTCRIDKLLNKQIDNINYGSTSWRVTNFNGGQVDTDIYLNAESISINGIFNIPIYNTMEILEVFRLDNNICTKLTISEEEKLSNDYLIESECESKITALYNYGYNLVNNKCESVNSNPQYKILSECQDKIIIGVTGYIVQDEICKYVESNPNFNTLSECQESLTEIPINFWNKKDLGIKNIYLIIIMASLIVIFIVVFVILIKVRRKR